jgi:hypothetical protein
LERRLVSTGVWRERMGLKGGDEGRRGEERRGEGESTSDNFIDVV